MFHGGADAPSRPAPRGARPLGTGLRTIFNLLGPMCNPAGVTRQVLGVYAREWLEPMAMALRELGSQNVWLLHGSDGLDEATTTGKTFVVALEDGALRSFEISPEDAGLPLATAQDLKGGDPAHNAALCARFSGSPQRLSRHRCFQRGCRADRGWQGKGFTLRREARGAALDSGGAREKLEQLVRVSNERGKP